MFFVFNKQKIITYFVSLVTVLTLFFVAGNLKKEETVETSAGNEKLLPIYDVETKEKKVFGISRKIGGTASERFKAEHTMWADDCDHIPEKICKGYDGVWYGIWNMGSYAITRDEENITGS